MGGVEAGDDEMDDREVLEDTEEDEDDEDDEEEVGGDVEGDDVKNGLWWWCLLLADDPLVAPGLVVTRDSDACSIAEDIQILSKIKSNLQCLKKPVAQKRTDRDIESEQL